ncbi:MAG TPA: PorV/PorQ family protein [Candidatus Krumholzibacteria bacterium]|nr:PorV/PorQ family protein [Candidatus Krumholzibacteria bacterium]
MHRIALALGLVAGLGATLPAQAQDESNGVPGDWLSRYSGARSVGYGGAFVAAMNEPMGVLWNPAGLALFDQNEAQVEMSRLFEGTSVNAFSFAVPAKRIPSFGITLVSLSSGEFERTNELNESLGSFEEGDMAVMLTASKALTPRLSLGANFKVARQTLEEFEAAGFGVDLGAMADVTPNIRLGLSLLNVGGPSLMLRDLQETYPTEFRGGVAFRVLGGRGTIAGEVDSRDGPGATMHAGSEFWVHPTMALRLGYNEAYATGGVSYRLPSGIRFDYGVSDHELGLVHRVGLTYKFGGFFASSVADPPVFSPTGQQSVTKIQLESHTKTDSREWSLVISSASNQVVRAFGGKGATPAHVMWDGKDEYGMPLADGIYSYQLVVIDNQGREIMSRTRSVEISTGGPQGSVPVYVEP